MLAQLLIATQLALNPTKGKLGVGGNIEGPDFCLLCPLPRFSPMHTGKLCNKMAMAKKEENYC